MESEKKNIVMYGCSYRIVGAANVAKMGKTSLRQNHGKVVFCAVVAAVVWFLCFHTLMGGTLLEPDPYNSYLLQAKNWVDGTLEIENGEKYTWLELAIFKGGYYLSFPPVPSVIMVPWYLAFGMDAPSNFIIAVHALVALVGVYFVFAKMGWPEESCLFWAALATFGSNFLSIASSGGVWYQAQMLNFCFVAWGIVFWLCKKYIPAFFLLALSVGCRPFSAIICLILYVWSVRDLWGNWKRIFCMSIAPALVAFALGMYNFVRFGNPLEFGHNYLPEFLNSANGQFSVTYLVQNLMNILRPVTLDAALNIQFELFNGFMFFVANPIFAVWAWEIFRNAREKTLQKKDAVVFAGFAAGMLALCLHKTMGGWQFGTRYLVDLISFCFLFFIGKPGKGITLQKWCVLNCAVIFNMFGTVYINLVAPQLV